MRMVKNCDCNGNGLMSLTLKYVGIFQVNKIEILSRRQNGKLLCVFYNVSYGETIICDGESLEAFKRNTYIHVTYKDDDESDDDICEGTIRTDCSCNILGQLSYGCDDIMVIGWIDKLNVICDDTVTDYYSISENNALVNDELEMVRNLKVLNELDPYIKWSLIGMMFMFLILVFIGVVIGFHGVCRVLGCCGNYESSKSQIETKNLEEKIRNSMLRMSEMRKEKDDEDEYYENEENEQSHGRHRSINFEEEELIIDDANVDDENDRINRMDRVYTHSKHKSINMNEEEYLDENDKEHYNDYCYGDDTENDNHSNVMTEMERIMSFSPEYDPKSGKYSD